MANDNRYTITEVERLADELCTEFGNSKYFKWYCGIIYNLGIEEVKILKARVSDAKFPGMLFSKLAKEHCQEKKITEFKAQKWENK